MPDCPVIEALSDPGGDADGSIPTRHRAVDEQGLADLKRLVQRQAMAAAASRAPPRKMRVAAEEQHLPAERIRGAAA